MPLTPTVLISGGTTTDSTAFTSTAAIAPASNRLLIAFAGSHSTHAGGAVVPAVSGLGLTWELIGAAKDGSSFTQMSVHRAMGTPSAGSVTWSFSDASSAQVTFAYSVVEWIGASTSGSNGAGAIVQVSTNSVQSGAGSSVLTLSLPSPFVNSSNVTVAAFAARNSTAVQTDPAWTTLFSTQLASPASMYRWVWFNGEDRIIGSTQEGATISQSGVIFEIQEQTIIGVGQGVRFRGAQLMGAGAL